MQPKTRYAKSGDVHIAYQVFGEGPRDLVLVPGWSSQLEVFWENPAIARGFERQASFSRIIIFDKRGTGLSDRATQLPILEEHMDDVRAVMDAIGSESAALLGWADGGGIGVLFAATYPERTTALILDGSFARAVQAPNYPWGFTREGLDQIAQLLEQGWGEGVLQPIFAPSLTGDEAARQWWARLERTSASPAVAMGVTSRLADIDVRHVLPSINVPTLVLHRTGDTVIEVGHGRYLAQHIPGAKLVELPGIDNAQFVGDSDAYYGEIEEFLTGVRRLAPGTDRVLATVLFADIASSSEKLAEVGDTRWRDLLETYYGMIRRQLERFRGREVKTIGDGFLATFDGPARAIRCAKAIVEGARSLGIEIRVGLHTGECEIMGEDIAGIAVHIGSRVATEASPGEILVSSTVKDLVAGSGLEFADRGPRSLKGVPGERQLFAVG
jgi:class 3 adenylate cyclase/pimeloyl-ACP methyl ester carboxylesterase